MKFHICIPTDKAIELLAEGKNLFDPASPADALKALYAQQALGKNYFTGCDNEGDNGMCNGHPD